MKAELIQAIGRYIELTESDQRLIGELFRKKILEKNDYWLLEGEVCRHLGLVTQGVLRYFYNRDGEEITYNFGREGDFVCNYLSFFQQQPSAKIIQATEPTELLVISYEQLQRFYQQVKDGERFGRLLMEKNYAEVIHQLTSQYTDSPEKRYLNFLHHFPDLVQRLPQYYIASYVGVKPQSLSRIRKRLLVR
ncbi:Crp/Fnr family transcriptional regulator [Larkinella bovis]|uniref:Crp/Fnr family transcriptional regulator n=1 Tax=Larkinella bovis TaxID=683041 RepID=A0ABW0IA44_9BACT